MGRLENFGNSLHFRIGLSPPIRPARAGLIRDAEVTEKDILYGESRPGGILHKPSAFGKKSLHPG